MTPMSDCREPKTVERIAPVAISDGMNVGEGFRAIARNCLDQLGTAMTLVTTEGDHEAIHQCRVAISRLRIALALFGPAVDQAEAKRQRRRLRRLAHALAPARDLDVLIERIAPEGSVQLVSHLAVLRDEEVSRAAACLARPDTIHTLTVLRAWLDKQEAAGALEPFAAKALDRYRKSLPRKRRRLRAMDDGELHRLRLKVKRLRYATGFLAPVFRNADAAPHEHLLARLQDKLGTLHDMAVAHSGVAVEDLAPEYNAELRALLTHKGASRGKLLRSISRLLKRHRHAPRWWRDETGETDGTSPPASPDSSLSA